jgi:hypothetical protein
MTCERCQDTGLVRDAGFSFFGGPAVKPCVCDKGDAFIASVLLCEARGLPAFQPEDDPEAHAMMVRMVGHLRKEARMEDGPVLQFR